MHIVKFLGAYCKVFQVCGTDSKVYKHTLPSFPSLQLYVAKFVGAHCRVSDSKFSKLANPHCQVSKSMFSGWRVHIARFPNPFFQVDKFKLPNFQISNHKLTNSQVGKLTLPFTFNYFPLKKHNISRRPHEEKKHP
jgi:hypothetical protein